MTTKIPDSADLGKSVYPRGFFITEDDEIVYSTGKADERSAHVLTIRMLELEGPTEQYELFDTLTVASYDDACWFYDALVDYIDNKITHYNNKIKELQRMYSPWDQRLVEAAIKEEK